MATMTDAELAAVIKRAFDASELAALHQELDDLVAEEDTAAE